jgi:hypothetical protein
MSRHFAISAALIGAAILSNTAAKAQTANTVPPVYSWMLPKTVLDVSIIYTYAECKVGGADGKTAHYKFNVVPTVTSRSAPDEIPGWRTVDTNDLISFWNDQNITIGTYSGTHILSSVAANPTSQIGTIVGNVLTGAVKLAALSFGVVAPAAARPAGGRPIAPMQTIRQVRLRAIRTASRSWSLPCQRDQHRHATECHGQDPGTAKLDGGCAIQVDLDDQGHD